MYYWLLMELAEKMPDLFTTSCCCHNLPSLSLPLGRRSQSSSLLAV